VFSVLFQREGIGYKTKKPCWFNQQGFTKYGTYLLSRTAIQYHRP
jgi:hypothetical protein